MHTGELVFTVTPCKINSCNAVALLTLNFKFYLLVYVLTFIIFCRHVDVKYMCVPKNAKYRSSGPFGFREEDFFSFSHCKSMETIYARGVAKFDPRGMAGTIYVEDH